MDQEIPKYKKRKRKISKKSNHKHEYEKCLIMKDWKYKSHLHLGKRCSICKKISPSYEFIFDETLGGFSMLNNDAILDRYKNLMIFTEDGVLIERSSILDK